LDALRDFVSQEVRRSPAETTRQLTDAFKYYAARVFSIAKDENRAAAKQAIPLEI
jgi:hypothetical protein